MHQMHTNNTHVNYRKPLASSRLAQTCFHPYPAPIPASQTTPQLVWPEFASISHTHTQKRMGTHTDLCKDRNRNLPRSEERPCRAHRQDSFKCSLFTWDCLSPFFLIFYSSPKQSVINLANSHNPFKHPIKRFSHSQWYTSNILQ